MRDAEYRDIQPWDSDHTALVHVLWSAQREGLIPREVNCDELASKIMRSKWMRAVRLHAQQSSFVARSGGA